MQLYKTIERLNMLGKPQVFMFTLYIRYAENFAFAWLPVNYYYFTALLQLYSCQIANSVFRKQQTQREIILINSWKLPLTL